MPMTILGKPAIQLDPYMRFLDLTDPFVGFMSDAPDRSAPIRRDFGSLSYTSTDIMTDAILANDGHIYTIPASSPYVFDIDPENGLITQFGYVSGTIKWGSGCLAPNGKIYGTGINYNNFCEIDPVNKNISMFGSEKANMASGGVVAPNGKIYIAPGYADGAIRILDPETKTVKKVLTNYGTASVHKWGTGTLHPNGKIYFFSASIYGNDTLEVNPENDTWRRIGPAGFHTVSNAVLAPNGWIYLFCASYSVFCKFNPVTEEFVTIQNYGIYEPRFNLAKLAPNGLIYGVRELTHLGLESELGPDLKYSVFSFDPETDQFTYYAPYTEWDLDQYRMSVMHPNGKMYLLSKNYEYPIIELDISSIPRNPQMCTHTYFNRR